MSQWKKQFTSFVSICHWQWVRKTADLFQQAIPDWGGCFFYSHWSPALAYKIRSFRILSIDVVILLIHSGTDWIALSKVHQLLASENKKECSCSDEPKNTNGDREREAFMLCQMENLWTDWVYLQKCIRLANYSHYLHLVVCLLTRTRASIITTTRAQVRMWAFLWRVYES